MGRRLTIVLLLVSLGLAGAKALAWPAQPAWAQVPGQEEEWDGSEPLLQVAIVELTVQGEQPPEAVREAVAAILPSMAACLRGAQEKAAKIPARLTLRFNLSGSGKVVWVKLVDPTDKNLENCLGRALAALRLPSNGSNLSRVTLLLACRTDHLLNP
jgi:hypothetical protein